ncbi:MAG TPA: NYN domain-containing protein [Planctomycetota bacterium]|nr:NYN domain-containing protein [Planctomycetota bacterium]
MMNGTPTPAATQSALIARTFPQRLGIFVDVQNMFYSAKLLHQSKVDYGRLLREITGTRHLIRAIAYIVQKPDVNQAGFHEALSRFGYELKIKELKIRPDPDGRAGTTAKGSWEIGMTIDAITMAQKLDCVTLVTGDGDYVPLVDCLKMNGCRVEVVSFERSTAGELIKAADQYIPIQEAWIFKEKKFENASSTVLPGVLGNPPSGVYEGLPRDEDLDADSAAAARAATDGSGVHARFGSDVHHFDEDAQPPNVHHAASGRTRERSAKGGNIDLGILS